MLETNKLTERTVIRQRIKNYRNPSGYSFSGTWQRAYVGMKSRGRSIRRSMAEFRKFPRDPGLIGRSIDLHYGSVLRRILSLSIRAPLFVLVRRKERGWLVSKGAESNSKKKDSKSMPRLSFFPLVG